MDNKLINVAVIGCGNRGSAYANYTLRHPSEARILYTCDIKPDRLEQYSDKFGVPKENRYENYSEMLDNAKDVDIVIVSLLDPDHYATAREVLEKGYHCLLEKPMAPDPWECLDLCRLAEKNGRHLMICHVLRYTPFFTTLKELVDSGDIGRIISIHHSENVSYTHMAHSYVRGNFRNYNPIILAKSCHDLDILNWLTGRKCLNVSSLGSLTWFRPENAPKGSAKRCMDCAVEKDCAFSACKQYLTDDTAWPTSMISVDTSIEARTEAVKNGSYGRCVYHCDNEVADHQLVNMQYEDDITVSFVLSGFNAVETREIRITGTEGDIFGNMEENYIRLRRFGDNSETIIRPKKSIGDHSGGDEGLMKDLVGMLRSGGFGSARTTASISVDSHLMGFAAEKSRKHDLVIDMEQYKQEVLQGGQVE